MTVGHKIGYYWDYDGWVNNDVGIVSWAGADGTTKAYAISYFSQYAPSEAAGYTFGAPPLDAYRLHGRPLRRLPPPTDRRRLSHRRADTGGAANARADGRRPPVPTTPDADGLPEAQPDPDADATAVGRPPIKLQRPVPRHLGRKHLVSTLITANSNGKGDEMNIIAWIVVGLVGGAIARLLMPGRDPGGLIITIVLGVAGAILGGFLSIALGIGNGVDFDVGTIVLSVVGAMILLAGYRMVASRA